MLLFDKATRKYRDPNPPAGGPPPAPAPNPAAPPPGDPAAPPKGDGVPNPGDKIVTMTQAELDRIITDRLARQKDGFDKITKDAADADALAKAKLDGKKDEVITAHETSIATLKPKADAADRYAVRINALIDSEVASWPPAVKKLDPDIADAEVRMTWVENSRDLAKQLLASSAPPPTQFGQPSIPTTGTLGNALTNQMGKYKGPPGLIRK